MEWTPSTEPTQNDRRVTVDGAAQTVLESVEIAVSDTGSGIPADDTRERLRSVLYSTKPNGMGMGLPISRTIIEAHGGQPLGREQQRRRRNVPLHAADLQRRPART